MKSIQPYDTGQDIPSNAKYIDMIIENSEPIFFYEVPDKVKSSVQSDSAMASTIERVIKYLNAVTGSKYTSRSKAHSSKIRARINEGAEPENFKEVIDNMSSEWLDDPKWSKFLRPETLFSNKFWSYLSHKTGSTMTDEAFNELDKILGSEK